MIRDLIPRPPEPDGLYRHYKGTVYRVITAALHTETGELLVIYRRETDALTTFARPLGKWNEPVTVDGQKTPRFTRV